MNKTDNEFNEHNSIALIEYMINKAKNQFSENGHLYLVWGWVVFLCSLSHFLLLNVFGYDKPYLVWLVTTLVAIYQVIYLIRRNKTVRVRTYTDEILGYVWFTFIITMFLMAFIIVRSAGNAEYRILNTLFLALYGVPTFLSGVILRMKALVAGGIACWILCILSTYIPPEYQLLLISAAMVLAWIIPGYLLKAKYKKAY